MKYANEIFFLVFALILWGLLYGSRFILTTDKASQPAQKTLANCPYTYCNFIHALRAGVNSNLVLAYISKHMLCCQLYLLRIILPLS
jgi:hypothetical protein